METTWHRQKSPLLPRLLSQLLRGLLLLLTVAEESAGHWWWMRPTRRTARTPCCLESGVFPVTRGIRSPPTSSSLPRVMTTWFRWRNSRGDMRSRQVIWTITQMRIIHRYRSQCSSDNGELFNVNIYLTCCAHTSYQTFNIHYDIRSINHITHALTVIYCNLHCFGKWQKYPKREYSSKMPTNQNTQFCKKNWLVS